MEKITGVLALSSNSLLDSMSESHTNICMSLPKNALSGRKQAHVAKAAWALAASQKQQSSKDFTNLAITFHMVSE